MAGQAGREVFYEATPRETFADAVQALESVGVVLAQSDRTKTATARVRYGLQRVAIRVSVVPARGGSVIKVSGASDDLWGAGARKASDKFIRALG